MHYDHAKVMFLFWLIDYWWLWMPRLGVAGWKAGRWLWRKRAAPEPKEKTGGTQP